MKRTWWKHGLTLKCSAASADRAAALSVVVSTHRICNPSPAQTGPGWRHQSGCQFFPPPTLPHTLLVVHLDCHIQVQYSTFRDSLTFSETTCSEDMPLALAKSRGGRGGWHLASTLNAVGAGRDVGQVVAVVRLVVHSDENATGELVM